MPMMYSDEDILKIRKIRDSFGVMTTSPNLSTDEKALLLCTLAALAYLPGVSLACESIARGVEELDEIGEPYYGWRQYV